MTTWLRIPEFPAYEASDGGEIRRTKTGRVLRPALTVFGYRQVALMRDGKRTSKKVHTLVALAWLGPRPVGMTCSHLNNDKLDNRPSNLTYESLRDNMARSSRRGANRGVAKLTEAQVLQIREELASGASMPSLAKRFAVNPMTIYFIKSRRSWKHLPASGNLSRP